MKTPIRRPKDETARLGDEIYERDIRPQIEETHHGKIVAIDVDSGDYAIGNDVVAATDSLREEHPDAINVLCERVGHRTLYHFGGSSLRRAR